MRLRALIFLAGVSACSSTSLGGLKVSVRFLDTDARCAKVFVTGSNGGVRSSQALPRTQRDRVVGLAQDESTGGTVDVQARGYLSLDCADPPIDFSQIERRTFYPGDVSSPALLVLKGGVTPDAGTPDGGPAVDAGFDAGMFDGGGGGTDGGPEQCGNAIDDDRD
ncbi:MAG: hypothetical protein H6Q89_4172, partial [Myxococcaceae bacterium]|nr:hypothetical protein [Myxococcaceae bacterium]